MKQVAATRARRDFFTLLDKAAAGEIILIERKGISLRLARQEPQKTRAKKPDYRRYIKGPVDQADEWSWDWSPSEGLKLKS